MCSIPLLKSCHPVNIKRHILVPCGTTDTTPQKTQKSAKSELGTPEHSVQYTYLYVQVNILDYHEIFLHQIYF